MLHLRGGRLCCESKAEVTADGHPIDRHVGVPLVPVSARGGMSFVITNVMTTSTGRETRSSTPGPHE